MTAPTPPNEKHGLPEDFRELVRAATDADGQPPFSDQSLVDLAAGTRSLTSTRTADGLVAAAVHSDTELELVVAPDARRRGHGAALAERVLDAHPEVQHAWAHGDHPASRILARRFGFEPTRTLLQLRAPLPEMTEESDISATVGSGGGQRPHDLRHFWPEGVAIRAFRPGEDDTAWLDLNARAFADHPEQGSLTQRDLDARKAENWFDPDDFLLLHDGETLIGSNWLKIDPAQPGLGEIYAISIDPDRQGEGHSRRLMDAGLARLRDRGVTTASLYVEADNTPALALYERYGFTRHTIDIQYTRESHPPVRG